MERRDPPPTEEGWYALHDFRTVDWDAWYGADADARERAVESGRAFLADAEAVADAEAGASVTYGVLGHKADLLVVHLRPTTAHLDALERRFEQTALARYADRASSYVSVTEVSGYSTPEAFEDGGVEAVEDSGLRNYLQTRLYPQVPEAGHVCFYPMDKRRGAADNWYDLPFETRADHMRAHGEIGREYAGQVTQVITGSVGLDDWEWGVTLFADDPTAIKRLLYEMRFDPSTSRFAEFGSFYVGRRLPPDALGGYLAGEPLGEAAGDEGAHGSEGEGARGGDAPPGDEGGRPEAGPDDADEPSDEGGSIREELAERGVYAGQPHGEDVHALVLYVDADADELLEVVRGLRDNFEHYGTHEKTAVYAAVDGDRTAVVSLWATADAAEVAAGYLADLPGVVERADEAAEGWGTMGLFYAVVPEHREDFVETFESVGELLADMDGHRETTLLANAEDENDLFIASRWRSREDAMAFFRDDAFRETVEWGREVLADRPRHVFLA